MPLVLQILGSDVVVDPAGLVVESLAEPDRLQDSCLLAWLLLEPSFSYSYRLGLMVRESVKRGTIKR